MLTHSPLLHQLISQQAKKRPESSALIYKNDTLTYQQLEIKIKLISRKISNLGIEPSQRIGIYLPKRIETVCSFFAVSRMGGIFVPINPVLKVQQVDYILRDCNVRLLITSYDRYNSIKNSLRNNPDLEFIILIDKPASHLLLSIENDCITPSIYYLEDLLPEKKVQQPDSITHKQLLSDDHSVAILYTSGSTGKAKGVVLSHRNIVLGAKSVSSYLKNTSDDKILAVLPFSFDYGLNQLSSAFFVGASVVLMDYLLPADILKAVIKYHITGLAGVPSLWIQLSTLSWDKNNSLRYITNSGGTLPIEILNKLKQALPNTTLYLMYGLTEAFRSTYVPPEALDSHQSSIGIAIPHAQILVLREDGSECDDNEAGELVHKGELVAQGYWNKPDKTAKRFKPIPSLIGKTSSEIAVWSGDTVRRAEDGYLYFIGRKDDMIKTSGYRISPNEIEEVLLNCKHIKQVIALGIKHATLGQAIVLVIVQNTALGNTALGNTALGNTVLGHTVQGNTVSENDFDNKIITDYCKANLANYMHPKKIIIRSTLPLNQNGKVDRQLLANEYKNIFL